MVWYGKVWAVCKRFSGGNGRMSYRKGDRAFACFGTYDDLRMRNQVPCGLSQRGHLLQDPQKGSEFRQNPNSYQTGKGHWKQAGWYEKGNRKIYLDDTDLVLRHYYSNYKRCRKVIKTIIQKKLRPLNEIRLLKQIYNLDIEDSLIPIMDE